MGAGYTARVTEPPIVVVCALEYERRRLARRLRVRAEIVCSGPGPQAMTACVDRLGADGATHVILAGVAGGLRPTDVCPPISRVVDREGHAWTPSLKLSQVERGVTILGVDQPVGEPHEKAALGVAHDADLVDCESHAFAARATHHALEWAIARGVSDGPGDRLDPRIVRWTDEHGATRPRIVLADLTRHPSLIGAAVGLGRRSARAMDAVAARVDEIIRTPQRVHDG